MDFKTISETFKRAFQLAYYRWVDKLRKKKEVLLYLERNGAIDVQSTEIKED